MLLLYWDLNSFYKLHGSRIVSQSALTSRSRAQPEPKTAFQAALEERTASDVH